MQNTIKTRSGRTINLPTPEEDEAIKRGIAQDPDTYEVSSEDFKKMKPLGKRGRPKASHTKELVSIRYDVEVLDAFRSSGEGWQTRMNDALKDWLHTHQP
ncbi:BrnA antitoxin family protein [Cupriavidus basilensis]|uniref:BrnA antitoxin family protein n=1 Tax=Cupriavidus basilensis TaxID=68895 RepID=A0ABT6AV00_9BURK|nr:BrnA antitoxin family protein [Cupriavidus basilensis]MDF3835541.1 BrnA antitoxin family protein [Cupriavidus basilensis]